MRRISELKLLEFIASLKYYVGFWPRAIIFARLCGIMGSIEKNGSSNNNCDLERLGINDYDIYTQHFFFWVYKQIFSKSQEAFSESPSGNTWLDAKNIPKLNKLVLRFIKDDQLMAFEAKVKSKTENFSLKGKDKQTEGIDIDKYMFLVLEEFIEIRRRNLKALKTAFFGIWKDGIGFCSAEDFGQIIRKVQDSHCNTFGEGGGDGSGLGYCKGSIVQRAYLYSMTSRKNDLSLNADDFLLACHKFGLNSPFPNVSTSVEAA